MAIGYLNMQARTAHDAVPLSGVQIRVLDAWGNSLYSLVTDENGETDSVPLETVDKSYSQNQYFSEPPMSATMCWHKLPASIPFMYRIFLFMMGKQPLCPLPLFRCRTRSAVLPKQKSPLESLPSPPTNRAVRKVPQKNRASCARSSYRTPLLCILALPALLPKMCRYPSLTM